MLTLSQKVTVHCTDNDKRVQGIIARIRPDGFDVDLEGGMTLYMKKLRPGIYVGERAGMEFVVRTIG